jgi:hypothetical protein
MERFVFLVGLASGGDCSLLVDTFGFLFYMNFLCVLFCACGDVSLMCAGGFWGGDFRA